MNADRPLAVKIYCGAIVLLFAVGLIFISLPALSSQALAPIDVALSFVPLLAIMVGVWGVWQIRWWGVVVVSLLVVAGEAFLILAIPEHQYVASIGRAAIWLIPLWLIAWAYRKRFR